MRRQFEDLTLKQLSSIVYQTRTRIENELSRSDDHVARISKLIIKMKT
jgi:hypothetical protein